MPCRSNRTYYSPMLPFSMLTPRNLAMTLPVTMMKKKEEEEENNLPPFASLGGCPEGETKKEVKRTEILLDKAGFSLLPLLLDLTVRQT